MSAEYPVAAQVLELGNGIRAGFTPGADLPLFKPV